MRREQGSGLNDLKLKEWIPVCVTPSCRLSKDYVASLQPVCSVSILMEYTFYIQSTPYTGKQELRVNWVRQSCKFTTLL